MAASSLQFADVLRTPAFWMQLVARCEERLPSEAAGGVDAAAAADADMDAWLQRLSTRRERLAAFRALVEGGEMLAVAEAVARQAYEPSLPTQLLINKGQSGRKRVIYVFAPRDDLLFKAVNRHLQEVAAGEVSALCHSFQPGRGAKTAFAALLSDPSLDTKCCIRLDVADYFNSIDADLLIETLPAEVRADPPLMHLLTTVLGRAEALRGGRAVPCPRRGVMAGSALSCMLSNFYLKDLDDHFQAAGLTYARYSDDMILFARPSEAAELERRMREHLAAKGLAVNEAKSQVVEPGAPWEYLGLSYHRGVVDLSAQAQHKFKAKVRRFARACAKSRQPALAVAGEFVRRLNRRCYGVGSDHAQFAWAVWFFPVLTSAATLSSLDRFTQAAIRFSATRTRSGRGNALLPYATLRALGYIPLTMAYYTFKRSPARYSALLSRRTGPPSVAGPSAAANGAGGVSLS